VSFEAKRLRVQIPCKNPPSVFLDDSSPAEEGEGSREKWEEGPPVERCHGISHHLVSDFFIRPEVDEDALRELLDDLEARGTEAEGGEPSDSPGT
jgi:hypothetical protein